VTEVLRSDCHTSSEAPLRKPERLPKLNCSLYYNPPLLKSVRRKLAKPRKWLSAEKWTRILALRLETGIRLLDCPCSRALTVCRMNCQVRAALCRGACVALRPVMSQARKAPYGNFSSATTAK
jgi:hypothetical protein